MDCALGAGVNIEPLRAPFPWFGGKSRAAPLIWEALGDVANFVEPFAGSLATLLARPHAPRVETVNDADGFLANFWRAVATDPEAVARWTDWPVSECDLSARHLWLVERRAALTERLQVDPGYFDAKIAGWWVWGLCAWIGSGWCSGDGPWTSDGERWINRQLPHLNTAGQGINRKLPHLNTAGRGINRQLPHLNNAGRGINRKLPHLDGGGGRTLTVPDPAGLTEIAARLRRVRIVCGDWRRVLTDTVLRNSGGVAGVLLDPPYSDGFAADGGAYSAGCAGTSIWGEVAAWAIEAARADPSLRIVLCGYEGSPGAPAWRAVPWKAHGGYGSGNGNSERETLWMSPACEDGKQTSLFGRSP